MIKNQRNLFGKTEFVDWKISKYCKRTQIGAESSETQERVRVDFGKLRNDKDFIIKSTNLEKVSIFFRLDLFCFHYLRLSLSQDVTFKCNT